MVDRVARGRFASDLAGHLGPSLFRQPAIVRIRRLSLRVVIPASELNEDSLSRTWTQSFSRALFTALAYPSDAGPIEIFRAESLAAFLAGAIRAALDGVALDQWQYAEFAEIFRLNSTPAALRLLCDWPWEALAILLELARSGTLDRLLPRFDDLALEQIFLVLASAATEPARLSPADLSSVARLALTHPPGKTSALPTRRYALRLFVAARMAGEPVRSPRTIFHSLLALAFLLNDGVFFRGATLGQPMEQRFPAPVAQLIEMLSAKTRFQTEPDLTRALDLLLTRMRTEFDIPTPSAAPPEARRIASAYCGIFFLSGILDRLRWVQRWRRIGRFQSGGISCLLAGLALAIVEKFENQPRMLDSGIALFSGYEGDPDLEHLRAVFQEDSREVRLEVLHAAFEGQEAGDAAESWVALFNRLAQHLLELFRSRIRGFRQAAQSGVVRTFIARPGRILVEPHRIVVVPDPSAFLVALRIAGLDSPLESLSWLYGRRLEFHLEGL